LHIPVNAPSLLAAREVIAAARHSNERLGLGLADVVELNTTTLTHEELIELVAVLALAIERLVAAPHDVLERITGAIVDDTGRR